MTKKEFADYMLCELKKNLDEKYRIYLDDIQKNNGVVLKALIIKEEDVNSAPVVYMDPLYESYCQGTSAERLIMQIKASIENHEFPWNLPIEYTKDFDEVRDKLVLRVVNYEKNEKLLKKIPHKRFLDLAITFRIVYGEQSESLVTAEVTNDLLENWDTSVEELFELTTENSVRLLPVQTMSLERMVFGWNDEDVEKCPNIIPKIYVLTNLQGINGAAAILYPDALKKIADQMDSDLLILPSSVHEVLYLKHVKDMDTEAFVRMVRTVNENDVAKEEVLSDSVYIYRRDKDLLEIAACSQESASV